jgi:prephenate dehydrogenase
MNVGIVGLGLIGGSMAKSIKSRTAHTVWGADLDAETMTLARIRGDRRAAGRADARPVRTDPDRHPAAAAEEWVRSHRDEIPKSAIAVDLCGVKRTVCGAIAPIAKEKGFAYIGGHPMAGRERGGFVNSTRDLFTGAPMILTPDARTDMRMLETLKTFFTDIGFAGADVSDPDEHDRIIAYTSQLAHVVSSAYIKSPEAQRRARLLRRQFSGHDPCGASGRSMWTELFLDNTDYPPSSWTF